MTCSSTQRTPQRNTLDSQRRWAIIRWQMNHYEEPCFGTNSRYFCKEADCSVRRECVTLRARSLY